MQPASQLHRRMRFVFLCSIAAVSIILHSMYGDLHHAVTILGRIGYRETVVVGSSFSQDLFHRHSVRASGSLLERLERFNDAVSAGRRQVIENIRRTESIRAQQSPNHTNYWNWDGSVLNGTLSFVWGARDGYMEELATKHRHIKTVFLPWKGDDIQLSHSLSTVVETWTSSTYRSNVLVQTYYQWTGDDQLCSLIEKRGVTNRFRYDSIFNRSCSRDIRTAAAKPCDLQPIYFRNEIIARNFYWPNDGNAYPEHYYSASPSVVFYVHIHHDAVVNDLGEVFSGNTSLAECVCRDLSRPPTSSLPPDARAAPLYDEVFSVGQMHASTVYHRAIEVIPRLAPFIGFLKENPQIRIQAGETQRTITGEIIEIFGLNSTRLISGAFRANVVYQPKGLCCVMPSVHEVQLTAKLYRDYIAKTTPHARPRDRLILIQRSRSRRFTQHRAIEAAMRTVAVEFNLTFTLYSDTNLPSVKETMAMFNAAVMVVGPHGAGMSNIMFSEPGTFVIEGVCNAPQLYLCFQRLSHVLGHRYHGIASRGGCPVNIDVPAEAVVRAVRIHLEVWKQMSR